MNNKVYVGRRMGSFEGYGQTRPIDGVALIVDEENEYRTRRRSWGTG